MSRRGEIPFEPDIESDEESDVDWDRYANVSSRAAQGAKSIVPSGDAMRWGGESRVHMEAVLAGGLTRANQPQVARAETLDLYARNWQLIGTVDASDTLWDADPTEILWQAAIAITMGAGQATLVHQLDLKALCALALGSGVYVAQRTGGGGSGRQIRPFVITGGIVGKAINVAVLNGLASLGPDGPATLSEDVRITIEMAPIMAGTGI